MSSVISVHPRLLRLGPVAVPVNVRLVVVSVAVAALCLVVACLSIAYGEFPLPVIDVLRVLGGGGTRVEQTVVFDLRMGRVVVALVVGASLAYAGALTQSVARNALASPDILGITDGASLAAAAAIVFTGAGTGGVIAAGADSVLATVGIPGIAILGALVTGVVIWLLAGGGRTTMLQMVLIGVGAAIFLAGLRTWLLAYAELDRAIEARMWLTGSLNGRDFNHAWVPLLVLLLAVALAGYLAFQLAALALGDVTAHVLGHHVTAAQASQLLTAVVLSAVAVSAAGPVPFIAFVAPQIARWAGGTPTPPLLFSALTGALLLSFSDLMARVILPWELPVGVFTAFVGAPVLLVLILRQTRKETV